jgi:uncharacterized protein YcfJ
LKTILLIFSASLLLISCKQSANEAGVVDDSKQATIDSMNVVMAKKEAEMAKQKSIDSMQTIIAHQHNKQRSISSNQTATAATPKKKGWSRAAKGAVIGAGVGAVTGALVDKKHGEGAIIGGLAGAGLGAGTGAILDSKKNDR